MARGESGVFFWKFHGNPDGGPNEKQLGSAKCQNSRLTTMILELS